MSTSIPHSKNTTLPIATYEAQLTHKVEFLQGLLTPFANTDSLSSMSVFKSAVSHYRMRAEFGVWHEGDVCFYTMVEKDDNGDKKKVRIETFATANHAINDLMPLLLAKIHSDERLKTRLFQVEFLSTLSGDMLVTLIYHKKLEDDWLAIAVELEQQFKCHIIGRSRKQKLVVSQDYVIEKLDVLDRTYTYKQLEGGFTQPNALICQSMLGWACQQAKSIQQHSQMGSINDSNAGECNDLLELYCGNANFTLPLSQYFTKTLATEISKTSVAAAQWNIKENSGVASSDCAMDVHVNIDIARLSAEEFTEAKNGMREFRRLKQAGIELSAYHFSTIFVDPPRAGIDDNTLALMAEFNHIIYISCNPDTLADNLTNLCQTHEVVTTALFDQFPYTHHIEAGVYLRKKGL